MEGISVILSQLSPGMSAGLLALTAAIGYLLGNCNGAVMVSKFLFHDDVRTHGSGNGGLTNFHRTYGGRWVTLVVIAVDMLKVVASVAIAWAVFTRFMPHGYVPLFVKYWAGIFTVVGHVFPFALNFHGGKGILAGGTLALLVDWRVAVCAWGCFFIGVILTRWVSLGSLLAATAFGVSSALFHPCPSIAIPALLAGALIDWKHRENLKRILDGTESKLTFRKAGKREGGQGPEADIPADAAEGQEQSAEAAAPIQIKTILSAEEAAAPGAVPAAPVPAPAETEQPQTAQEAATAEPAAAVPADPVPAPAAEQASSQEENAWAVFNHWDKVDSWLEVKPAGEKTEEETP